MRSTRGADLRYTESRANPTRTRSAGAVSITEAAYIGENGIGNYVSQPPCHSITNPARLKGKQRQLTFLHPEICRNCRTVRYRRENTAPIYHVFAHQINLAVYPLTSGRIAIRHGVCQIKPVLTDVSSESHLNLVLRLFETCFIHISPDVAAYGGIRLTSFLLTGFGIVHLSIVETGVGYNHRMVGVKCLISTAVVIIESGDTPIHTVNHPVVTDIQIGKLTA